MKNNMIIMFLSFLLPFYLLLNSSVFILPAWLCLFTLTYLIFKLTFFRKLDYLYASFLVFFYVFLFIAPILQTGVKEYPWFDFYLENDIVTSWWVTFFALICFEIGYVFTSLKRNTKHNDREVTILSQRGMLILFSIAVGTTVFGLVWLGFSNLFISRNALSEIRSIASGGSLALSGIIESIMRVPTVIILLIFTNDYFEKKRVLKNKNSEKKSIYMMLTLFFIILVVNNPVSTARFWIGAIALSFALYFIIKINKSAIYWFCINVLILILIFPTMDMFRKSVDVDIVEAISEVSPLKELTVSPDFDAFQQQLNTIVAVQNDGFQNGNQIISSLFFFVPRSFWPSKAEPTGVFVAEYLNYNFLNLSAPITAEFYLDGGLIGVIIGMLILGSGYSRLQNRASNNNLLFVFYCFFCAYQTYLLRGSLIATINYVMVSGMFLYVVFLFRHLIFSKVNK